MPPPPALCPHAPPLNKQDIEAAASIEMDAFGDAGTAAAAMQQSAEDRAKKATAADDAGLALDPSGKPHGVERVLV